ncbi:hypothetical protein [Extensimonas sp. H3M7-6]|uniref:hypothetical protein n=1 Tax=Extensimonas soli TaxID=3031322 RepID=UPI0023DA54CE|nr:hypothetical protein [Extensimonas sp. H3M7-6]MDF1481138.1 hypothetical protein [Extensimonas sp. H3M7-6]
MDFGSGQGANRSDTGGYREDLQRGPAEKTRFYVADSVNTTLAACRTLGVESENAPQRGQFLPDSPPHSGTMGQEDGKKWAAAAHSQPTIPKSDRLLGARGSCRARWFPFP